MKYFLQFLLLLSSFSLSAKTGHELTLYVIPSPLGLDWSSPKNIAFSALKNRLSFKPRFIGHVFVELKCNQEYELTGMTGKNFDYLTQLLIEQRGMGILFHSFEGTLEKEEEIAPELKEYLQSGYTTFTRFKLNEKQCQRLSTYLREYKKNNVGRHYGLVHRPRYGEGAGCSAFAVSFPQVLDILDQEMKDEWSQTILIPQEYAGPPIGEKSVALYKVLMHADRWANHHEKNVPLTFWDPDKMNAWIKKKVAMKQANYQVTKIGNAEGIVFDKSYLPAPEKPIWLQHTDPTYKKSP